LRGSARKNLKKDNRPPKDGGDGAGMVDFKGKRRTNQTHRGGTGPQAKPVRLSGQGMARAETREARGTGGFRKQKRPAENGWVLNDGGQGRVGFAQTSIRHAAGFRLTGGTEQPRDGAPEKLVAVCGSRLRRF